MSNKLYRVKIPQLPKIEKKNTLLEDNTQPVPIHVEENIFNLVENTTELEETEEKRDLWLEMWVMKGGLPNLQFQAQRQENLLNF